MLLRLALVAIVAIAALALATGAARSEGADALRLVLFSGTELGEGRAGTSGGFKLALRGDVDRPGPIVMGLANAQADVAEIGVDAAVGSVGATRVDVETPRGFASGALIGGWQWFTPGGSVLTLAAGPEAATRAGAGTRRLACFWGASSRRPGGPSLGLGPMRSARLLATREASSPPARPRAWRARLRVVLAPASALVRSPALCPARR